jgi:hypothetical protein
VGILGVCVFSSVLKARTWKDNFTAFSEFDKPDPNVEHAQELLHLARIAHQNLFILDFSTSVVVSSMTTGLIMARLLLARKKMQRIVGELGLGGTFKSTLPYGRVVTLLLEPALPFTLVGVVGAIATAFLSAETGEFNAANKATIVIYAIWCNSLVSDSMGQCMGFLTDIVPGAGPSAYYL